MTAAADRRAALVGGTVLWAASRILIESIGVVVVLLHPGQGATARGSGFFFLFDQWDSGWFADIATHGYHLASAGPGVAFFPGYPLVSGALAAPFGGGPTAVGVAMWVVPLVATWVAAVYLWRLAADQAEQVAGAAQAAGARATAYLLFGPYALFLVASYSEALFLAFAVPAWWCATRGRWWWAGVLGAAAGLTRISGLFLAAGLVVLYLVERRRAGRPVVAPAAVGVCLSFLGGIGYLVYVAVLTGSPTGWFSAQGAAWDRAFTLPWTALYHQVTRMFSSVDVPRQQQAWLELAVAVVCVVCLVVLLRRRRWGESVYLGLSLAALMTSTSYESLARNALTLFPVFVLLGQVRPVGRLRWVVPVALALSVVLLGFNISQFVRGFWAD